MYMYQYQTLLNLMGVAPTYIYTLHCKLLSPSERSYGDACGTSCCMLGAPKLAPACNNSRQCNEYFYFSHLSTNFITLACSDIASDTTSDTGL